MSLPEMAKLGARDKARKRERMSHWLILLILLALGLVFAAEYWVLWVFLLVIIDAVVYVSWLLRELVYAEADKLEKLDKGT